MEYYMGLDMGTNSVGWAVTDQQYNLIRRKGKDMWGIREFDRAEAAAERRLHRVSRRSNQRSRVRIGLLKEIFSEALKSEDENFLPRLDNSFYKVEDKDGCLATVDSIFADRDYRDADYYKDYPTIFHLKYDLIMDRVPDDGRYARKVYLALLNYFKRRGHFLNESLSGSDENGKDVWTAYTELCDSVYEELEISLNHDSSLSEDFRAVFCDASISRSGKRERLMELLGVTKKNVQQYLILSAVCGLKTDLLKLFSIESEQKADLDFSSSGMENRLPEIYSVIGESFIDIIDALKQVYDAGVLAGIMSGTDEEGNTIKWLSQARVSSYVKHKKDLKILKECIRKYCDEAEYDHLFRENEDDSYSAYVGSVNSGRVVRRGENLYASKSGERYTNLKKRIKKDLADYQEDENVKYIFSELDTETFLPKQLTFANGVIPNQLHEREVRKILDNASKYLPFLNEKDESGLTNSEKIVSLFTFRVPYFIGPVSQNYKGNGWAVRKSGMETEAVYPWNIEDVIDYDKTREKFIVNMVRECSYIAGEKVLPKESMEYQAFMVLNTINNIKVRNEKISCALKQDIYHDVFEKNGRVTKNKILRYLNNRGIAVLESELSGIDTVIGCQLSAYRRFYGVLGDELSKDSVRHMVEDIIFKGTVYSDSKEMVREMIVKQYGDILSPEQIKRIMGFKFRDWGNLSKQFLELEGYNKQTGEIMSLIRALWEDEDNLNLMELLHSDKYTFEESLKEKHQKVLKPIMEFTYNDLDEMYFSAPVKRMIWQTLLIIREVTEVMGCPPKKLFVEMTRSEEEIKGDAGRKDSREKELLELYKKIKEDRSWDDEIKEAGLSGRLRSKKLYLYYKQKGRDMYTGLPIDLGELFDDNKYDIDHIYPRHYVKDDSIHNNLVLVDKRKNSRKSDNYPIDADIRGDEKIAAYWRMLHQNGFMNDEKYRRLTGNKPFTEEQQAEFIARQLVETSQATKGVNDLLKEIMPEGTTLVYSKARNVSDFRRDFNFYKSRMINDFHHAHDAYFNIVVGNVYYTKFTLSPMNFVKKERGRYNLGRMFESDVVRNGYTAWDAPVKDKVTGEIIEPGETLAAVQRVMSKNTPLLTRLSTTQHGAISDATIYSASKAKEEGFIPVKSSNDPKLKDVTKYGGFNSIKIAYYFLVEHEVAGKGKDKGKSVRIRTIECLPVYKRSFVESHEDGLHQYCLELGLKNPSVRVKMIKPQSLIKVDGFSLYITGKTNNQYVVRNACNLILNSYWDRYIHLIEKYKKSDRMSEEISTDDNLRLYDELVSKHKAGIYSKRPNPIGTTLENGRDKFIDLEIDKQVNILVQILNLSLICNSASADLKEIGGSSKTGVTLISKKVSGYSEFKLINYSVTGLYKKEVDLLTI
jgi:CRISPR-associated endonuclease Csn1